MARVVHNYSSYECKHVDNRHFDVYSGLYQKLKMNGKLRTCVNEDQNQGQARNPKTNSYTLNPFDPYSTGLEKMSNCCR